MGALFNGTRKEASALLAAMEHNCACEHDPNNVGVITKFCAPHDALVNDQRFLNGLVFVKRNAAMYSDKEWTT